MAQFSYTALDSQGNERSGTIEAVNVDVAIAAIQRRGLIISNIQSSEIPKSPLNVRFNFFHSVKNSDIVMVSRQITTLFEAQVSALRAFQLLAAEARTPELAEILSAVANDIQSGSPISTALSRHPKVFSPFYVNMVRAGEEAGKLDETFAFLAGHLDRNYEITQKARNALIYPAFIIFTFITVMTLMMTMVVPRLAAMLTETGQTLPLFTRMIIGVSTFVSDYILFILVFVVVGVIFAVRHVRTEAGSIAFSRLRLRVPIIGDIFQKLFLSRIADNLATMLKSGIQILRGIEITASVVDDPLYEQALLAAAVDVKGGMPVSEAFRKRPEIPGIIVAMLKIGEETGNMGSILETMARFYRREVDALIDTMVGLIEPFMIVTLAVGVGILMSSILLPIYNIASSF